MSIGVDVNKCLHCGLCVGSCPFNAVFLKEVELEFNDDCTNCGICVRLCPIGALSKEGD